jgi:tetratricopeptide (TPR) repeat protein
VYAEQGKNADSLRILRQAVTLAPNSAIAWRFIGYVYHYAGLTDLAEAAWRRGRDLDPSPAQSYWMHGRMLLYQGKTHDAEEEVRRALERYPDQFKLLTILGYFLYYEGKLDEAQQTLDRASQLSAAQAGEEPMVMSAMVHASRGECDKINPRIFRYKPEEMVDGDLAEWIGAVYALLGEKEPALAWLRRAVQVEIITTPGSSATRTGTSCAEMPNSSASWAKSRATGSITTNSLATRSPEAGEGAIHEGYAG